MKIRYTIFILLAWATLTQAQDMQYSYWQFSPISYNPAFTGAFYGNLRVNGLYRDQWRSVSAGNGFQTLSLSLDGNIPFGLKETDWVSVGLNIAKDQGGDTEYRHGFQGISAAYHLTLGKDASTILTVGGKYGSYSRGPKRGQYTTGGILAGMTNDIDLNQFNSSGNLMEEFIDQSTNDLMVGVMLFTPVGKTSDIRIGFAFDHVLAPDINVTMDTTQMNPVTFREKLDRRLNIHAQFYTDISDKVTFNPTVLYQSMGGASNILVQSMFSYAFKPEKEIYLNGGLGIRLADNSFLPIYLGADYKDWRFGFSYALNMGGLGAVTREGAFELAVTKVFSWQKKTKVNPKFICPRL